MRATTLNPSAVATVSRSRIVLVGQGPPDRGGIAAFIQGLLASRLIDSHELRFVNVHRNEAPNAGRLTHANVSRTLSDAVSVWRAGRRADVVHIHSALLPRVVTLVRAGLLAFAARLAGCRVIMHVHTGYAQGWMTTRNRRLLARVLLASCDRVVTVCEGSRAALETALGGDRVLLIDNGVDLSTYYPAGISHSPPRILYVGVLAARKGVIDLLLASEILSSRGVDHELLIVGGTPEEGPHAEVEVRSAATNARARFLGPHPASHMPRLYRDADLFCLPSWTEGMPLSIFEAMASGLPVVATRVGDIPRAIEEGVTGFVVPPGQPEAIADALEPLLRGLDLRRKMGLAARRRVQSLFDAQATHAALGHLYRELAR